MTITPQLLKRYHQGQCSSLERSFVEAWLAEQEDEQQAIFPLHENELDVKNQMWNSISTFMDEESDRTVERKKSNIGYLFFQYAAAACIVLAVVGWSTFRWSTVQNSESTELVMDNLKGAESKKINNAGLSFTLTPKSKAETKTDWASKSGEVNFCGNIVITNNSDEDIELRFNTSCQNSQNTQKTLKCEKGKTYVAIHFKFNKDEIMVFDKSELATAILPIHVYNELERI